MDRCERCTGPIERTNDDRFICPRCGIWVHLDGAALGPPITPEQAAANYERFAVETAAQMVQAAQAMNAENVRMTKRYGLRPMAEIRAAVRDSCKIDGEAVDVFDGQRTTKATDE
jgi:hypothetical protein